MPRHRGSKTGMDNTSFCGVSAADLPERYLKHYLCELGPRFCPICFSRCAFGERYLAVRRAARERGEKNARNRRAPSSAR